MPNKRKPKVALYIRVSTHHQIDKDSLPFQRQELENYSLYVLNIKDYVFFEDAGYSAKNTDRPKYQEMMTRIRKGEFTHLLVWKLDRISRNLRDFTEFWDELKEYGVTFISKMEQFDTSSAMGEAMLRIILVFAELERKLTAERVFSIMLSRAEKGLWNGAPVALGYEWDEENETIKIEPEEAELVQLIYDMYEERQSALDVAQWLHENNKQTKRGGSWYAKGVIDILRNPSYTGIYRWNHREAGGGKLKPEDEVIIVEDALPAIISREQWERVQKTLDSNYKGSRTQRYKSRHIHLLTGLIKCPYCGKNYVCSRSTRPHKHGYHPTLYRCGSYVRNRQCHNKAVSGLYIEPFVLEYIRAYVQVIKARPKGFNEALRKAFGHDEIEFIEVPLQGYDNLLNEMAGTVSPKPQPIDTAKIEALTADKQKIERAISRLDDAYYFAEENKAISKTEYLLKRAEFRQRLDKTDNEMSVVRSRDTVSMSLDVEMISKFLLVQNLYRNENIRDALPFLDKAVLQEFLQKVIKSIEVADGMVRNIEFQSASGGAMHKFIYRRDQGEETD